MTIEIDPLTGSPIIKNDSLPPANDSPFPGNDSNPSEFSVSNKPTELKTEESNLIKLGETKLDESKSKELVFGPGEVVELVPFPVPDHVLAELRLAKLKMILKNYGMDSQQQVKAYDEIKSLFEL